MMCWQRARALLFFGLAASRARNAPRIALLLGIFLYVCWVIQVGGDFMRGRFLVSVLTGSLLAGALSLAEQIQTPSLRRDLELLGVGGVIAMLFIAWLKIAEPPIPADLSQLGVINERKFWEIPCSLSTCLKNGEILVDPAAVQARQFADSCGGVTVHRFSTGIFGYFAGPKVKVIDLLGMTDSYIARLPKESLVSPTPRPGHPLKRIPLAYLISQKDVMLLPNWEQRIVNQDCSLNHDFENLPPPGDETIVPQ